MAQWRRPQFVLFALLAIFSLVAPSLVWACPVTGRLGTPTQVCQRTANGDSSYNRAPRTMPDAMPCCAQQQAVNCLNTCCHAVPRLPGSDDKGGTLEKAHAGNVALSSHLSQAAQSVVVISVLQSAPLVIEPTQACVFSDDASPLPLKPQHTPATQAGRAPPSL